jgi:hypothetical protein
VADKPPPQLQIDRSSDGQLIVVIDGKPVAARAVKCFPWSEPQRFISLRDDKNNELMLVNDLAQLDPASRKALELALLESGFVLEIIRIDSIEEEYEIRNWKVVTKQGARTFQTERDAWPRAVPGGGLLVRDVAGDLFHVQPESLDAASRKLIWALVD